ncbi:MAG: winged helix-turn-helix transcriptional regulator [Candidatus Thorarchaeota archaeon]
MDPTDKTILLALDENCRLSYQSLADMLGVTANAVKKRMDRLIETGVIEEYSIVLRPAMMGSDYLIALVSTDGSENEEKFMEHLGSHLMIIQVGQIVTGTGRLYFLHCEYIGAEGLQNVGSFLRTLESVTNIELHTILTKPGEMFEIKNLHLRVLKYLLDDARMQVSEISEQSGLTSRRVSRAIQEMQSSNAFWFAVRWNLSLGQNTEFYLKIEYDEQVSRMDAIDEWLRERFPDDYWFSFYSAMEPILFAKFVTNHFRDAEEISRSTKNTPFSKSVDVLLSYPVRKFTRLGKIKIEEMIRDSGI